MSALDKYIELKRKGLSLTNYKEKKREAPSIVQKYEALKNKNVSQTSNRSLTGPTSSYTMSSDYDIDSMSPSQAQWAERISKKSVDVNNISDWYSNAVDWYNKTIDTKSSMYRPLEDVRQDNQALFDQTEKYLDESYLYIKTLEELGAPKDALDDLKSYQRALTMLRDSSTENRAYWEKQSDPDSILDVEFNKAKEAYDIANDPVKIQTLQEELARGKLSAEEYLTATKDRDTDLRGKKAEVDRLEEEKRMATAYQKYNDYFDITKNPDFEEVVAESKIKNPTLLLTDVYFMAQGGKSKKEIVMDKADEQEESIYRYLKETQGDAAADKFINDIAPVVNKRHYFEVEKPQTEQQAKDSGVLSSLASIAVSPAKGFEYMRSLIGGIAGEEYDPYDESNWTTRYQSDVRGTISQGIQDNVGGIGGSALSFLYGTGMSMGDSALAIGLGAGLGLGQAGTLAIMGTGAASSTAYDIALRGGTSEQALLGGALAGIFEVVFEKVSLERFLDMDKTALRPFIINMLAQGGIEASEEVFTEIANIISDFAMMGDKSNYNIAVQRYIQEGDSQATAQAKALWDQVGGVALAGIGGFISGVGFGTVGATRSNIRLASQGKTLAGDAHNVINQGLSMPEGTLANQLATKNQAIYDKKGKISNLRLGRQYAANTNAILESKMPAIESRVNELKISKSEKKTLISAFKNVVTGNQLSPDQILAIEGNDDAHVIFNELTGFIITDKSTNTEINNIIRKRFKSQLQQSQTGSMPEPESNAPVMDTTASRAVNVPVQAEYDGQNVEITQIKDADGSVMIELSNGESIPIDQIEITDPGQAVLFDAAVNEGYGAIGVSEFINQYKQGASIKNYTRGFSDYYHAGLEGEAFNDVSSSRAQAYMSKAAMQAAYDAGVAQANGIQETRSTDAQETSKDAAEAPSKGGVTKQYSKAVFSKLTSKEQAASKVEFRVLDAFGKKHGVTFNIVDHVDGNAFYDKSANEITIGLNAMNKAYVYYAFHEVFHMLKEQNPDQYNMLHDFMLEKLLESNEYKDTGRLDTRIDQVIAKYQKQGKIDSLGKTEAEIREGAIEELLADAAPVILNNEEYVRELYEADATLFEKIRDFFVELYESLKALIQKVALDSGSLEYAVLSKDIETIKSITDLFNATLEGMEHRTSTSTEGDSVFKHSFAGVNAENVDMVAFEKAMTMKENDESDAEILKETGWFLGADGYWRFEIDDSEAVFDINDLKNTTRVGNKKLGDVLKHDKLYAHYPTLKDIEISLKKMKDTSTGAYINIAQNRIVLNIDNIPTVSLLIHEIQHAIQNIEGFAKGGGIPHAVVYLFNKTYKQAKSLPEFINAENSTEKVNYVVEYTKGGSRHVGSGPVLNMYLNLAGEIEARNSSDRQSLATDDRRVIMPDVRETSIVVTDWDSELALMDQALKEIFGKSVDLGKFLRKHYGEVFQYDVSGEKRPSSGTNRVHSAQRSEGESGRNGLLSRNTYEADGRVRYAMPDGGSGSELIGSGNQIGKSDTQNKKWSLKDISDVDMETLMADSPARVKAVAAVDEWIAKSLPISDEVLGDFAQRFLKYTESSYDENILKSNFHKIFGKMRSSDVSSYELISVISSVTKAIIEKSQALEAIYNDPLKNPYHYDMDEASFDLMLQALADILTKQNKEFKKFKSEHRGYIDAIRHETKSKYKKEFDKALAKVKQENTLKLKEISEKYKKAKAAELKDQADMYMQQYRALADSKKQALAAQKEMYKAREEISKEKRKSTEIRGKIKRLMADFNQRLLRPAEGRYVPQELISTIIEVGRAIDLNTGRPGRYGGMSKTNQMLNDLKRQYDKLAKAHDYSYSSEYDNSLSDELDTLIEAVGDTPVRNMTLEQLKRVYGILKRINHALRQATKLVDMETRSDIYHYAEEAIDEIDSANAGKIGFINKYIAWSLNSTRMFRRMAGYKDDSRFVALAEAFRQGEIQKERVLMQGTKLFSDFLTKHKKAIDRMHGKKAELIDVGLKDQNGNTVKITPMMRVSVYLHSLNKDNMKHILHGGLTIPNMNYYKRGKYDEAYSMGNRVRVTEAQIKAIVNSITPLERELADIAYKVFNDFTKGKINETSIKLLGFEKAGVEHYFPIISDRNFLRADFETIVRNASIEGMGMLKARQGGSNPVYLEDVLSVVYRQLENVAKYNGLAIPVRNFNKVYNVTTASFDGKDRISYVNSLRNAITHKWGKTGMDYVENLLADLQGARRRSNDIFNKLKGNFAQAVLAATSVILKQMASYPTVAGVVGWKPILKGLARVASKSDKALIAKYTPLLWVRSQGAINSELGDMTRDQTFNKKVSFLMNGIEKMDTYVSTRLWFVAEYYVDEAFNLKRGTDEYYEQVAKVFNDIMHETQANYSVTQRAAVLRSPNEIVKVLTMFMDQPLQNFGILFDAHAELKAKKHEYRATKTAANKAALKNAHKRFINVITSQVVGFVFVAYLTKLSRQLLHRMNPYRDDDEEITEESFWDRFWKDALAALMGSALGGDELYTIVEAAVFQEPFFEIEIPSIANVNEFIDGFIKAKERLAKLVSKDDEEKKKGLSWNDVYGSFKDIANPLSTLFGIPTENILKAIEGIAYHIEDASEGEFWSFESSRPLIGANRSYELMHEAIESGDTARYNKIYDGLIEEGKAEETIYMGMRKLYYKDLVSGLEAKVINNVNKAIDSLKRFGAKDDDIKTKINEQYKQQYIDYSEKNNTSAMTKIANFLKSIKGVKYTQDDLNVWIKNDAYAKMHEAIDKATPESLRAANKYCQKALKYGAELKNLRATITRKWKPVYIEYYTSGQMSKANNLQTMLRGLSLGESSYELKDFKDWLEDD